MGEDGFGERTQVREGVSTRGGEACEGRVGCMRGTYGVRSRAHTAKGAGGVWEGTREEHADVCEACVGWGAYKAGAVADTASEIQVEGRRRWSTQLPLRRYIDEHGNI